MKREYLIGFLTAILGLVGGYAAPHTGVGTTDPPQEELSADKVQILSDYIYASARLGDVPVVDVSIASLDEVSAAYVDAVEDKDIENPKSNLFETLRDEAVARSEACKKI